MSFKQSKFLYLGNDECLDFINTEITERGNNNDLLGTIDDLVRWLSEMDYIDPGTKECMLEMKENEREAVLEWVRKFRSELRQMVETLSSGKPLLHKYIDAINDVLVKDAEYKKLILIDSEARLINHRAVGEFDPLVPMAGAAAALLTEKDAALIRKCEAAGCGLYFYDESKNHARRWCSMKRCGNRMKAAQHYRKKKGAP